MTHKEMMNIKYETCDLWNSLKDKSKIVDTLIDLKEQNLKLKAELEELKKNAIVPKLKIGDKVFRFPTIYEKTAFNPRKIDIPEIIETKIVNILYAKNWVIWYRTPSYLEPKTYSFKRNQLFLTKEQAEEALKKADGENGKTD